jgi:hypothetical protein
MKRAGVRLHLNADIFEDMMRQLSVALAEGIPEEIIQQFVAAVYAGADVVTVQVDQVATPRTGHVFLVAEPTKLLTEFMTAVRADNPNPSHIRKALSHLQASIPDEGANATTKWQPYKRDSMETIPGYGIKKRLVKR